jgi:hypothetical protein
MDRPHVVFAVTSHGLGHLSRTLRVAAEFLQIYPGVNATISGRAQPRFLSWLPRPVNVREIDYEPGTAQSNCFQVDVDSTRAAYRRFSAERADRLRREEEFLRTSLCTGLVADIPALPVRAARQLGIPTVGVSNFTWDWILEPLIDPDELDAIRTDYACGDLFLSLPFGPGTSPFRATEHVPLVGPSPAKPRRSVLAHAEKGRSRVRPRVLVCAGGWGARGWPAICVNDCEDFEFVIVGDLPVRTRARTVRFGNGLADGVDVADLVADVDAVLTKPGYGIASECVVHRTPMVGVERRGFREAEELVRGLRAAGPFATISIEDFFAGFWERPLRRVLEDTTPWAPVTPDGARQVAVRLGEFFGLGPPSSAVWGAQR